MPEILGIMLLFNTHICLLLFLYYAATIPKLRSKISSNRQQLTTNCVTDKYSLIDTAGLGCLL